MGIDLAMFGCTSVVQCEVVTIALRAANSSESCFLATFLAFNERVLHHIASPSYEIAVAFYSLS